MVDRHKGTTSVIPSIDMKATGLNIARMRKNAGLTIATLQGILGFNTPQAIYKWQRGDSVPTIDNLVILAAVFGTTIDEIIVLNEQREVERGA